MFVYVDIELLELVPPQCVSFLASHLSLCLIQCFHGSIPLLLRPYVKDGKQLPASWISQHPPFFFAFRKDPWSDRSDLSALHTSLSGRKQWQNADRSTAVRSLWSRFLHLMQDTWTRCFHRACTHTHTRSCTEACFPDLISYREHFSGELCPKIHGFWLRPVQVIYKHHWPDG